MRFGIRQTGIAAIALFMMGALLAPNASGQFEAEKHHFEWREKGTFQFQFSPGGPKIHCTKIAHRTEKLVFFTWFTRKRVRKTYSSCDAFLGAATSVQTNGCDYEYSLGEGKTSGTMDIECEAGKSIEIKVGSICAYTLSTQTGLGTVTFANKGAGSTRELTVTHEVTGITSTRTTNHFFCPAGGSGGVDSSTSTVTGEDESGAHVGLWVD